ncbi:MAG: sugar ABC transporter permease [Eubacterium sp.]|nr:sugar ABC transporter permease [Eubacterium sp.]
MSPYSAKNNAIRRSMKRWAPLFVLPVFICFIISFVIPFVQGLYLSFTDFNLTSDATFVGVINYFKAVKDPGFISAFFGTALFAIPTVIVINIPAFFIAFFLSDKIKGVGIFRTAFFIPNLIGGVVLGYIWSMIFDGILHYFGTYLVSSSAFGFWGLVILVAWQQIGYMMIIYIAGFQSVPTDMLEAASVDGATGRQKLFRVITPNMIPTISVCAFLSLTNAFKLFDQNLALTAGAPVQTLADGAQIKTTELLALNIYNTYNINGSWHGTAQAKAVIFFVLVAIFAGAQQYFTNREKKEKVTEDERGEKK